MRRAADPVDLFIDSVSSRGLTAQLYDQVATADGGSGRAISYRRAVTSRCGI